MDLVVAECANKDPVIETVGRQGSRALTWSIRRRLDFNAAGTPMS